jgi:hypothetical protein
LCAALSGPDIQACHGQSFSCGAFRACLLKAWYFFTALTCSSSMVLQLVPRDGGWQHKFTGAHAGLC